jgi:hypothetical protein
MAIDKISGISGAGAGSPVQPAKEGFGPLLEKIRGPPREPGAEQVRPAPVHPTKPVAVAPLNAARLVDEVSAAQGRLDRVLELAQSGKAFTPAELLAMQAHVYRASQELDLAGKVVDKATGALKQVLNQQM